MKWSFVAIILASMFWVSPAVAQGQGCDIKPGREGGQARCTSGKICTGPYEGTYGRGNCQAPK